MSYYSFTLPTSDHHAIPVYHWPLSSQTPGAVIHIAHGMAEHGRRYSPVADALNAQGYAVVAHDHRGHGANIEAGQLPGHYADHDGWNRVVSDLGVVNSWARQRYPNTVQILLGHSMGSYIAQGHALRHPDTLDGLVLSGSTAHKRWPRWSGRAIAQWEQWRHGPHAVSELIDRFSFQRFNARYPDATSRFDWMTRDPAEIAAYTADPLCGFQCTNQLWLDLATGAREISHPQQQQRWGAQQPLLLLAGGDDAISDQPTYNGMSLLVDQYEQAGAQALKLIVYPEARHSIFFDLCRPDVLKDLLCWCDVVSKATGTLGGS